MHNGENLQHQRVFKRTNRPGLKEQNVKINDKKCHQDINNAGSGPTDVSDAEIPTRPYKCVGECDSIHKTFSHKDELDLHMMFHHKNVEPSKTQ